MAVSLSKKHHFLPIMFAREFVQCGPLHLKKGNRNKTCPRLGRSLRHDRGTDRNRRESNSLSPVLIHFVAPQGKLYQQLQILLMKEQVPPLLFTTGHPGPNEPLHGIPTQEWPNVLHRVIENLEPLRQLADE